jgi:dihydrodipicolinate synthase/N-acetylneuraminate lyase
MALPSRPGSVNSTRYPRALLATCPVPWANGETGEFDEPLFRRTVRHALTALSTRLYVFGTAGEGYAVTDRQFAAIVTAFIDEMNRGSGVPMVGVISLSLGTMVERIQFAHSLGVREFQISFPAWGALADDEVDRFFDATCGRFPDTRFLHYNLARAKRVLAGADYARIAARHPNLVAIKMGGESVSDLTDVAAAVPDVRCFFTEFGYIALRDRVDCGLLCALSVCEPPLAHRLFHADFADLRTLEPVFRALHVAAKSALGNRPWMDGAYDKMYLKRHFPEFPLTLLPPYSGASDAQFAAFIRACDSALRPLVSVSTS